MYSSITSEYLLPFSLKKKYAVVKTKRNGAYTKIKLSFQNSLARTPNTFYFTELCKVCTVKINHKPNRTVRVLKHLLVSVATMVMLCHVLVSLSRGVARVIFPSSALMLNCLSRSVWRSMENLQNRHPCNLLNEVAVIHTVTQTI